MAQNTMTTENNFYITTTLPYVNADPHIGFALELVQADAIARYRRQFGENIFFNTGTDEHGQKIYQKAAAAGIDHQAYCDEYAAKFKKLIPALGISPDIHFIRTTDKNHIAAAQEFWLRCLNNGDIYKAKYKVKYCVGCELEKTESDLDEQGRCLVHPHLEIELIEEENYFFKFEKYEEPLQKFYNQNPNFVVPDFRFNEIKEFVKRGLKDFSISRLKAKMPWGVPVPGDESHVMYVWFDALINYISTLGWGEKLNPDSKFKEFWPGLQIAGKDNLRQQSAMWQAMLMSAGLPNSSQIIIHGFITSGGQKMSKSLGNVADPYAIIDKLKSKGLTNEQAVDALRYYLLREIPTFEDGDYTWEKFVESYNAGLANGIGNQVSRILKLAATYGIAVPEDYADFDFRIDEMNNFRIKDAMDSIWQTVASCDQDIQRNEPFKKIKDPATEDQAREDIKRSLTHIRAVANRLVPFLPNASQEILRALKEPFIKNISPLFPRIQDT